LPCQIAAAANSTKAVFLSKRMNLFMKVSGEWRVSAGFEKVS
jgi:hypothetical protein